MKLILILFSILFSSQLYAQENPYSDYGTLHRFEFVNAPFPDSGRENGHTYQEKFYSKEEHYSDSTTLIFVPAYLEFKNEIEIVVYFHGWNNNVDTVLTKFKLIEQFYESEREAILVMPEGPRNSPDSFGGKLEETGRFKLLIREILDSLQNNYNLKLETINITLAGHSGAYRVIAYILMRGGVAEKIKAHAASL